MIFDNNIVEFVIINIQFPFAFFFIKNIRYPVDEINK